jgi:hypothetical protein
MNLVANARLEILSLNALSFSKQLNGLVLMHLMICLSKKLIKIVYSFFYSGEI